MWLGDVVGPASAAAAVVDFRPLPAPAEWVFQSELQSDFQSADSGAAAGAAAGESLSVFAAAPVSVPSIRPASVPLPYPLIGFSFLVVLTDPSYSQCGKKAAASAGAGKKKKTPADLPVTFHSRVKAAVTAPHLP